jgi:hypothetical protein
MTANRLDSPDRTDTVHHRQALKMIRAGAELQFAYLKLLGLGTPAALALVKVQANWWSNVVGLDQQYPV